MQSVSTPRAHMNADVGQVTKEMVLTARVSRLLLLLLFSVEIGWCDETGWRLDMHKYVQTVVRDK